MSSASLGGSLGSYFSGNNALYQQFCNQFEKYDPGRNGIPLASFRKICEDAAKSGNTQLAQINQLFCSDASLFSQLSQVSTSENSKDGIARVSLKDIQGLFDQPQIQQPPGQQFSVQYPVYLPAYMPRPFYYPAYPTGYRPAYYRPPAYSYGPYPYGSAVGYSPAVSSSTTGGNYPSISWLLNAASQLGTLR